MLPVPSGQSGSTPTRLTLATGYELRGRNNNGNLRQEAALARAARDWQDPALMKGEASAVGAGEAI
jgi:hypothetical protein